MTAEIALLRELHRMHRQQADIQAQLDRGPKQIKAAQSQLEAADAAVAQCRESIKKKRLEVDRKQLQMRERESKLSDLQVKLNGAKNNREYQTLKDQIAADKQANNVLSDEILETLEEIDALNVSLDDLENKRKQAEADRKAVEAKVTERMAVLKSELARVQAELKSSESNLKGELKSTYQRSVASRGEEALAEVEGDSCGGCYNVLTSQLQNQLRMEIPVTCTSCGRLLYVPEAQSGGRAQETKAR